MLLFHFKTLASTHLWLQQHFFEIVDGSSKTAIPCAGVTADKQTEGMEGVEWLSLEGTLSCSLLMPIAEHVPRKDWGLFSLIGANSLCTTLKELMDVESNSDEIWTIWPCGVMTDDGKLGAVISDVLENPIENRWFINLSFSVNLNHNFLKKNSNQMIDDIRSKEERTTKQISTEKCFLALYKQVAKDFKMLFSGKSESLLASVRRWASQEPHLRFRYENEVLNGRLLDILEDGSSAMKLSNGTQAIFPTNSVTKIECLQTSDQKAVMEHYSRA